MSEKIKVRSGELSEVYNAVGEDLIAEYCNEIEFNLMKMGNIQVDISIEAIQALCNYSDNFNTSHDPEVRQTIEKWRKNNPSLL